ISRVADWRRVDRPFATLGGAQPRTCRYRQSVWRVVISEATPVVLPEPRSMRRNFATCLFLLCVWQTATAQQPMARDTVPLRADYRDLAELLAHLPAVSPRSFDESTALWLGVLPLSCLDRLQPRPGGRGGGRATVPADSARGRGGNAGDSSSNTSARGSAPAAA